MKKIMICLCLLLSLQMAGADPINDLIDNEIALLEAKREAMLKESIQNIKMIEAYINIGVESAEMFEIVAFAYSGIGTSAEFHPEIPKNSDRAVELYKKAYALGGRSSAFNLATIYMNDFKDYEEAKKWFEISIEQGGDNKEHATLYLGTMYLEGLGVRQDCKKAIPLFESIDDKKRYPESLIYLGSIYSSGCAGEKDLAKAKEYYGQACDEGSQTGCDRYKQMNMQ